MDLKDENGNCFYLPVARFLYQLHPTEFGTSQ